jgi:hypothetical protein
VKKREHGGCIGFPVGDRRVVWRMWGRRGNGNGEMRGFFASLRMTRGFWVDVGEVPGNYWVGRQPSVRSEYHYLVRQKSVAGGCKLDS